MKDHQHRADYLESQAEQTEDQVLAAQLLVRAAREADTIEPQYSVADCTCYLACGADSQHGSWHTHEGEPCPVHPDAEMVG